MKLYDNVKIIDSKDHQYGSIVDFVYDEHFLIESWRIENNIVKECSLLIVTKDKLRKLTFTEEMEFRTLMDEYYKKNFD